MHNLDTLHIDILDRILDDIYTPYAYCWDERWSALTQIPPAAGLLPLSLVCKRLRAQVLPWIFRDVRFGPTCLGHFFSSHLWSYIRVFRFLDYPTNQNEEEFEQSREEAYGFLSRLPHVHTVFLRTSLLSPALVHAVASLPCLSSLTLYNSPPLTDADLPSRVFHSLSRLVHVNERIRDPLLSDDWATATLGDHLHQVVDASASTLVHLDIPGRFARLERLGNLPLTSLQTLILRGHVAPPPSDSLRAVLVAAPRLCDVHIDLIVIGGHTPQFPVLSEETQTDQPFILIPELRSLTLGNAYPFDYIFSCLPAHLKLLSLPAVTFSAAGRRSELALSANAASYILHRCTASHLSEFRISIEGELPPVLFNITAQTFPLLQKLEVRHRPRYKENGDDVREREYAAELYGTAFSAFSHMRELSLDWPLTNLGDPDDYPMWRGEPRNERSPALVERNAFAMIVARSVPSLVLVRFRETKPMATRHLLWKTFAISHPESGLDPVVIEMDNLRPDVVEKHRLLEARSKFQATNSADYSPSDTGHSYSSKEHHNLNSIDTSDDSADG